MSYKRTLRALYNNIAALARTAALLKDGSIAGNVSQRLAIAKNELAVVEHIFNQDKHLAKAERIDRQVGTKGKRATRAPKTKTPRQRKR